MKYMLAPLFFISVLCACGKTDDGVVKTNETVVNWQTAADSSSQFLVDNFWNGSGKYFNFNNSGNATFNYWPNGHALDVVVDAYVRTGNSSYLSVIKDWYEGVYVKNGNTFLNVYYDDMEWNALALLRAYQATNIEKYKTAAQTIWTDIQTGWNTQGNGGVSWKKDQPWSKNACSNGPASILAAHMYEAFGTTSDKEWALKIYAWEKEYLYNTANGAVYDNLNATTGEIQKNWIFTYNEGTFLGAALELYKITGEKSYLNDAIKAADYTLNNLVNSNDQVLKEEGNGDGGLFKGVFIRYFTQLIQLPDLTEATRTRYINFLKHNAIVLWTQGTNKQKVLFGTYWKTKPTDESELTVQLSGCMLIEAAALLKNAGYIK